MSRNTQPPSNIKVLGRPFKILPKVEEGCFGVCYTADGLIHYEPSLRPIERADTVLHEVMHAILFCQGRGSDKHEERYVRALASGLITVLADNPDFASWLAHRSNYTRPSNIA